MFNSGCSKSGEDVGYTTHSICELASKRQTYENRVVVVRGIVRNNGFSGLELEASCPENRIINLGRAGDIPKKSTTVEGEAEVQRNIAYAREKSLKSALEDGSNKLQVQADVEVRFDFDPKGGLLFGEIKRFRGSRIVRIAKDGNVDRAT
jgi:hypothetical protein